jgi:hypothetical protein
MLYVNVLDVCPILLDDLPCRTIISNLWEDKHENDILAGCDGVFT